MSKFQVGDKIVCIDNRNSEFLKIGKIYTFKKYTGVNFIQINEAIKRFPRHSYRIKKFKKANSHIIREKLGVK